MFPLDSNENSNIKDASFQNLDSINTFRFLCLCPVLDTLYRYSFVVLEPV